MSTLLELAHEESTIAWMADPIRIIVGRGPAVEVPITRAEVGMMQGLDEAFDDAIVAAVLAARDSGGLPPVPDDLSELRLRFEGFLAEEFARLAGQRHPTHIDQARTFAAKYEPEPLPLPPAKLEAVRNACDHIMLLVEAA